MLLADATSKEEVEEALEAGDDELLEDIEYELRKAADKSSSYEEELDEDWREYGLYNVFEELKKGGEFPPEAADFLDKKLADMLADFRTTPRSRMYGGASSFVLEPRNRRGTQATGASFTPNASAYVSENDLPENWQYIPDRFAPDFWENVKSNVDGQGDWVEYTDRFGSNTIAVDGPSYDIWFEGDFDEFKSDLLRGWASSLERSNPRLLIQMLLDHVSGLSNEQLELIQEEMARGKIDRGFMKEAFDFAVQWAGSDASDAETVMEEFKEWLEDLVEPEQEEREELATITHSDLNAMGIAKGTVFWDNAPWRLVKLLPGDLRREGRLMRHCVGDGSRKYTQAVKNGEIEIWSLRDRSNKPSFTLEVATEFYDGPDSKHRAEAIKQLKGKTNRTPGFDSPDASLISPKKRDEVIVWKWLLRKLGVAPERVEDFNACRISPERDLNASTRRQVARALRAAAHALEAPTTVSAAARNEIAYLKKYLSLSDEDKARDLARYNPASLREWADNTGIELAVDPEEDPEAAINGLSRLEQRHWLEWVSNYLTRYDPVMAPAYLTLRFERFFRHEWLVHFTDHGANIVNEGFTRGVGDMAELALTRMIRDSAKKRPGYVFAFMADDIPRHAAEKYGSQVVLFQGTGVLAHHYGDEEDQAIVWGESAYNLTLLEKNDYENTWYVAGKYGDPVYTSRKTHDAGLNEVIEWVQNNRDRYRRVLAGAAALASAEKTHLLFCYGSNNPAQLRKRIGEPKSMEGAYAPSHSRVFRGWSKKWQGGVASLVPSTKRHAYGYVAEVTEDQLALMDQYEGVASGNYVRKTIPVVVNGEATKAIAYVSTSEEFNQPTDAYLQAVLKTIRAFWQVDGGVRDIVVAHAVSAASAKVVNAQELQEGDTVRFLKDTTRKNGITLKAGEVGRVVPPLSATSFTLQIKGWREKFKMKTSDLGTVVEKINAA